MREQALAVLVALSCISCAAELTDHTEPNIDDLIEDTYDDTSFNEKNQRVRNTLTCAWRGSGPSAAVGIGICTFAVTVAGMAAGDDDVNLFNAALAAGTCQLVRYPIRLVGSIGLTPFCGAHQYVMHRIEQSRAPATPASSSIGASATQGIVTGASAF